MAIKKCNAGSGCSISCSGGCYALRDHSTGRCYRGCSSSPLKIGGKIIKLERDAIVSLSVKGVLLVDVGTFMDKIYPDPIAIPASRALRTVSATVKDTPLSKVISQLGLLALEHKS